MLIDKEYEALCKHPSDINEHLPTLRRLSEGSDVVVEMGVRTGVSTVALLAGRPKVYRGYDLTPAPPHLSQLAQSVGVDYLHRVADVRSIGPIVECGLLFIDTLHNHEQLSYELMAFARYAKVIAMHDVVTYGRYGETKGRGLCSALFDFLIGHSWWQLSEWHTNNNGLAVIRRCE